MEAITLLAMGFVIAIIAVLSIAVFVLFRRTRKPRSSTSIHSTIEGMRAVGDLSVFKVYTKEIVTELDHSWGDFGKKYLDWIYSSKKMAMIFEFEIEFRYDLRTRDFEIIETGAGAYILRMPPCFHEINIRNIEFYDEQRSRLLPWLLPDLLNSFLGVGFTEEDRNKLVSAASNHAKQRANAMIDKLSSEVEASAKQTLHAIGQSFGAKSLTFVFKPTGESKVHVSVGEQVKAAA
ncbi:MAG: DUF4230 domain-containing protein [Betaproteobacteria bacterium]|nr:DUF4230 domain-containing protein [Betaproteobacteria bacterium]